MIGQTLFKSYLNSWELPPHFIILYGESGSGRNSLIQLLKKKFKFNVTVCGYSAEEMRELTTFSRNLEKPNFFIIYEADRLSNTAKNILLKVVEEPPLNAYFILRTSVRVIETLKNRAFYYAMQPYSSEEINSYFERIGKDKKYSIYCKNIGQAKKFFESPYEDIMAYCDTIINEISLVSSGNVLNITNKLSLKEDDNKWDLNLFFNILEQKLLNKLTETNNTVYFKIIFFINRLRERLQITGVNKQYLVDNFLLNMKYFLCK